MHYVACTLTVYQSLIDANGCAFHLTGKDLRKKKCRKKCLKAPFREPSHQDPWNFAGDTGKNSFYGSVEKMKLGLATGEIWRISREKCGNVEKSADSWTH
jgi:hypothetical protein